MGRGDDMSWYIRIAGNVDAGDVAKHAIIRRLARGFADICQALDIGVEIAEVGTPTGGGLLPAGKGLMVSGPNLVTNQDPTVGGTPTTGKPK